MWVRSVIELVRALIISQFVGTGLAVKKGSMHNKHINVGWLRHSIGKVCVRYDFLNKLLNFEASGKSLFCLHYFPRKTKVISRVKFWENKVSFFNLYNLIRTILLMH